MGDFEVALSGLDDAAAALGERRTTAETTGREISAAHGAFAAEGAPGPSRLVSLAGGDVTAPLGSMETAIDAMFTSLSALQAKAVHELGVAQRTLTEIRRRYADEQ
jgi:hypothetical protein